MLSGKVVNVNPTVSSLSEGFSENSRGTSQLFRLTYLYATAPKATNTYRAISAGGQPQNRSVMPEVAFSDTVSVTMAQHHFRARPMTPGILDEINLDRALAFYKERFADASDFMFFTVGNFQLEKIRPFVEQYLASLPAINRKESWRDVGIYPPKGVISKEVYRGIEPKSSVIVTFTGPSTGHRRAV
jgi:zinc protease